MTQPTPEPTPAGQEPAPANPTSAQPEVKKPWGDDSQFDPDKAWNLVENLRREKAALQEKASKFDESERAKMSEVDQHKTAAQTEKARADAAEMRLTRLEVGLANGLTAAQAARLSGSTKEEIEADGPKLAAELGIKTAAPAADPELDPEMPPAKDITSHRRPTQQPEPAAPRGGRTPAVEPEEDLSEIIASIPR